MPDLLEEYQLSVFRRWWEKAAPFMREEAVEQWERHLELFAHDGKSIDILECARERSDGSCECRPRCAICFRGKHSPYHGPVFGQPVGSPPWGHEYAPGTGLNATTREILRGLGR